MRAHLKYVIFFFAILLIGSAVFFFIGNATTKEKKLYCGENGMLFEQQFEQSYPSYCFKSNAPGITFASNTPAVYAFRVIDNKGNTVKDFALTHTKPMHMIVVRKDLKYFEHLHPEFDLSSGQFILHDLTFPTDGEYRIFADFAVQDSLKDALDMPLTSTVFEDVVVGKGAEREALGSEEKTKTFGDMKVELSLHPTNPVTGEETDLVYALTDAKTNLPIKDLDTYLGALGHAVILREGTLDFIHAHPIEDPQMPQNGKVDFMVGFPKAGKYKVFTQFERSGNVITTDFVIKVSKGSEENMGNMDMHQHMH